MYWICWRSKTKITLVEEGKNKNKCSFCTLYIVLFALTFIVNIGSSTHFIYYKYMNRTKETRAKESFNYQTKFDYWSYKMTADVKSIDIKNRTYYFFNDMINLNDSDSGLLKIDKKNYIGYIMI